MPLVLVSEWVAWQSLIMINHTHTHYSIDRPAGTLATMLLTVTSLHSNIISLSVYYTQIVAMFEIGTGFHAVCHR